MENAALIPEQASEPVTEELAEPKLTNAYYTCIDCGENSYKFKTKKTLRQHRIRFHGEKKKFRVVPIEVEELKLNNDDFKEPEPQPDPEPVTEESFSFKDILEWEPAKKPTKKTHKKISSDRSAFSFFSSFIRS